MKKLVIGALIASMIAMSVMAGCGSSSAGPQEAVKEAEQEVQEMQEEQEEQQETETTDADVTDAEPRSVNIAASADPDTPGTESAGAEMTAGPAEEETVSAFGTAAAAKADESAAVLPEFHYTGEDPYIEAVWAYFQENHLTYYDKSDISVPSFYIFAEDDSDPEDIRVWGMFSLYNYDLEGKTLLNMSGGDDPGLIHLKADGDSYVVTEADLVEDRMKGGMDYSRSVDSIFGEKEGLAEAFWDYSNSDEKQEETRADFLKMYINDNHLEIDAYQDYGWDPVPLK